MITSDCSRLLEKKREKTIFSMSQQRIGTYKTMTYDLLLLKILTKSPTWLLILEKLLNVEPLIWIFCFYKNQKI